MEMQLPESYLIRVWTEIPDEADGQPVLRGSIQDVHSGHKTYFTNLELPVALLRASVDRLAGRIRAVD